LFGLATHRENRHVAAFGYFQENGLVAPVAGKVAGQTHTQIPGFGSDNAVLARVIAGRPPEHMLTDQNLSQFPRRSRKPAIHNVKEKFT
jgi:hypothetical protein